MKATEITLSENTQKINRLAVINVTGPQSERLMQQLVEENFKFTVMNTSGGLVQIPSACVLVGLNSTQLDRLVSLVQTTCKPRLRFIPTHMLPHEASVPFSVIEAQIGGATLHILEVDEFWQL